jgi:hypothetical protein
MITVIRKSDISGELNAMVIPLDQREYNASFAKWSNGELIQRAFPTLDSSQREFIKTGITPEEWTEIMGEEV